MQMEASLAHITVHQKKLSIGVIKVKKYEVIVLLMVDLGMWYEARIYMVVLV